MAKDDLITSEIPFSAGERELIAAIAEMNISESAEYGVPSAADPQILAVILSKAADALLSVRQGLEVLRTLSGNETPLADDVASLMGTREELRSFDRMMMMIVAQAYYQDPRVLRSLGLADRAPFPLGHELHEGDWSLLDPVRQGGRKYREVPE